MPAKFQIVTFRDPLNPSQFPEVVVIHSEHNGLMSARLSRKVSGDVVVYHGTNKIVPSTIWLWDWELKKKLDSYAYRLVNKAKSTQLASSL